MAVAFVMSIGHSLLAFGTAFAIRGTLDARSGVAQLLASRPMQGIGRVSYGLYLYHPMAMAVTGTVLAKLGLTLSALTGHEMADGFAQLIIVSVAALGVAAVSHRWYEQPLLNGRAKRTGPAGALAI
jgi:peptidoglycan/LPS O-acetylase OafA/YrhL